MAEPARNAALLLAGCLAAASALAADRAAAPAADGIDIPFSRFVLANGLTLIVHEDHKAPVVAVNVWYHVGSKNERPGRTGFAHLFEHLMFNGSENFNDDYFKPFDRIGATGMNGTTNFDRTNYFQVVPTTALDVALWMESDRMGHLLGAIDQARLDEQRGVVQNEKRQGENQPYGTAFRTIFENTYPAGHPYSWSVIGSMEDLQAAALEDVHAWFRNYYGAANAVIVLAGDVDTTEAREKVERYFGDIPPGPPLERYATWIARRSGTARKTIQDRVPQARIYKAWNIPEWGTDAALLLELTNDILAEGKNSRLYERLVYRDQIATAVDGFVYHRELGGLFVLMATAQPGQDLRTVEHALDEELAHLLDDGPTQIEVDRVRALYRAEFLRGIERIGGFGGKSDILAQCEVYAGDPAIYKRDLQRVEAVQTSFLRSTAKQWLHDGAFVLEVHPFPEHSVAGAGVDRSRLPEPSGWPAVRFAERSQFKLSNGLAVILARRTAVPLVEFQLLLDAGFAADPVELRGAASLALDLLDEGTTQRDALQIGKELALAGAELSTSSDLDTSVVRLSALRAKLDRALEVFADVVLHPAFPPSEFERLKKERAAQIRREQSTPESAALRALPRLLYGEGHPYGAPLTGTGTAESLARMTVEDMREFHRTWFDPERATLIVVGDASQEEIAPKLEQYLGGWSADKSTKKRKVETVAAAAGGLYLIDRPDSLQSTILVGRLTPPRRESQELALEALNEILGGSFTARINMNLREDKHWSYGARSRILDTAAQRPLLVTAPVQTDKTAESLAELRNELRGIGAERPPSGEELARIKDKLTLTLPGRWETNAAVSASIAEIVRFDLDEDYWDTYAARVRALELTDVAKAAQALGDPAGYVWVVVGDARQVADGIRALGLGEPQRIDADGAPVPAAP